MNFVDSLNLFGVEAKEIPCIKGKGEPSTATVGAVGLFYMDTDTGKVYKCTAVADGAYTWTELVGTGGAGEDGGYYTPTVTQLDEKTMEVAFKGSKDGMPVIDAANIILPAGPVGATPKFTVGTVITGEAGADAAASITGSDAEPVLRFVIPQGPDGYSPEITLSRYEATEDAPGGVTVSVKNKDGSVTSQKVSDGEDGICTLPYGGSKEWLEANGDPAQLYQIDGYVWGYVESDGWTKSGTRFLVVSSESQMVNQGGTGYLLRSGNEGTVYAYSEASGDKDVPVYDALPETANEGDIVAVGGRKYKATMTSKEVPEYTNKADLTDTTDNNWVAGYRLNSSGVSTSSTATPAPIVTNYVACSNGDVIRVKGLTLGGFNCTIFKGDKVIVSSAKPVFPGTATSSWTAEMEGTDVYKFTVINADATYMRFSGVLIGSLKDVIITVNEEIKTKTETSVSWTDIGEYVAPVEAGWNATEETYLVIDSLSETANSGEYAVYSADGYVYTYIDGADWMQMSKYNAPSLTIDSELSDSSTNAVQNKVVKAAIDEIRSKSESNESDISAINERITNIETGSDTVAIPSFWQDAVDEAIAKIKALQVGRNCVTFPFFSDNHTRDGKTQYMGMMIAHIMKECGIPYCFFGGDAITSAVASTADSDTEFRAQAKAFDAAMSYIPDGRFCMALGNHEGYLKANSNIEGSTRVDYDRNQAYEIFMREKGTAQNKHFGGDGTYYYVDDIASKVRWIVLNTNGIGNSDIDSTQLSWFEDAALKFNESGWGVVIISHIPISNHYEQSNITNAATVISMLQDYMNDNSYANKAEIIGWYSGHIHRDRIYTGVSVNDTDDTEGDAMGFTQVTITSDHTTIAYPIGNSPTYHPVGNDDQSHAIDFVTINKTTRTVNITRLGIGEDRSYVY